MQHFFLGVKEGVKDKMSGVNEGVRPFLQV
jgi:hypothetical protein